MAIDEEFTGISFNNGSFQEMNPLSDSASSRYARMRNVAKSFGLMQLGIAVFEKTAKPIVQVSSTVMFLPRRRRAGEMLTCPREPSHS